MMIYHRLDSDSEIKVENYVTEVFNLTSSSDLATIIDLLYK